VNIDQLKEQLLADAEVRRTIGRRAYEIYLERRGHRDAHPAEDWLRAESEVLPRLIDEMIAHNERAIAAHDDADPVAHRAAEHMQEEIELASTIERSEEAKVTGRGQLQANVEALAATSDDDDTVPNAQGVLSGEPVKAAPKKAAAKKPAAKKAAAPKAPAAKKPAAKKPAAKKAAAKPAATKAPARPKKVE
jgi:hypothetical protein